MNKMVTSDKIDKDSPNKIETTVKQNRNATDKKKQLMVCAFHLAI